MYKYPDAEDYNFYHNIYNRNWEDGGLERKYISECIDNISIENRHCLLDVGCGLGKHFQQFSQYFRNIHALEPDKNRLRKAKQKVIEKQLDKKTNFKFHYSTIQDFNFNLKFNCILCSQIIQHIQTHDLPLVLKKLFSLLNKGGYLILLTTNCLNEENEYLKVNCLTNKHIYNLTEREFNTSVQMNDIFLPGIMFTEQYLKKLLHNANFAIIFLKKFNGYPKIKGDNFIFAKALDV